MFVIKVYTEERLNNWGQLDSNQRSRKTRDLQSLAIDHSATRPYLENTNTINKRATGLEPVRAELKSAMLHQLHHARI